MRWFFAVLAGLYALTFIPLLLRFSGVLRRICYPYFLAGDEAAFYRLCRILPLKDGKYRRRPGSYEGEFESRNVTIRRPPADGPLCWEIRFAVVASFRLSISREKGSQEAIAFQGLYLCSDSLAIAREFLSNALVQDELGKIPSMDSIDIGDNVLRCAFWPQDPPERKMLIDVLNSLSLLAHYYEVQSRELRVWTSLPSAPVCAYCREPLGLLRDQIHECPRCGSRLHLECYEENGSCTTYGCV